VDCGEVILCKFTQYQVFGFKRFHRFSSQYIAHVYWHR
jgi:hypothetical protein